MILDQNYKPGLVPFRDSEQAQSQQMLPYWIKSGEIIRRNSKFDTQLQNAPERSPGNIKKPRCQKKSRINSTQSDV